MNGILKSNDILACSDACDPGVILTSTYRKRIEINNDISFSKYTIYLSKKMSNFC